MKTHYVARAFSAALLAILPFAGPVLAQAQSGEAFGRAVSSTQQDLDKSHQELTALRESIRAEKVPMNQELGRLESELLALRRSFEETLRGQDTSALEATNLDGANKLRDDENLYISNLLDEYARGFETVVHVSEVQRYQGVLEAAKLGRTNEDLSATERLDRQAQVLRASLDRLDDLVGGTRFEGRAVDPEGIVAQGRFAMVGPVVMFAAEAGGASGLAVAQAGSTQAAVRRLEEPAMAAGLAQAVSSGEGLLPLDPTRGGALKELISRGSLIHYFKRGGPIMWPLLFVSLLATTVILERLFFLAREQRRADPDAVEEILGRVAEGDVDGAIRAGQGSRDYIARALTYAMTHRSKSLPNALIRAAGQELVRFTRGISILDTCVTMAPLLGLLGTVTGMMSSFGMLGGSELAAPAQITGGIAEALIATAFGLGIAVTALIPMNFLHSRADEARHRLEDTSTHLELLMKPILDAEAAAPRRLVDRHPPQVVAWPAGSEVPVPVGSSE